MNQKQKKQNKTKKKDNNKINQVKRLKPHIQKAE